MINPTECVVRIIKNDPDLAAPLFALLTWAANQQDLKGNNQYDEIMERLYARTQDSRESRETYSRHLAA